MCRKKAVICLSVCLLALSASPILADCPSADLTGDCFVDLADFTALAHQWLSGDPNIPADMAYIPGGGFEMGDHHDGVEAHERPLHPVLLDPFFMGRYEVTNQQYADFLNSALASGSVYVLGDQVYGTENNEVYCDTAASHAYCQIVYDAAVFTVATKAGRDMSADPMVQVSWYGAAAYCNWRSVGQGYQTCYDLVTWQCDFAKHGYRLPTEAEWEYAARGANQNPYYRFPWGDTINHDHANYRADGSIPSQPYDTSPYSMGTFHPDWDDPPYPYTSVVGSFPPNALGLYDMAGNVWDWCYDWYNGQYYDVSDYDNPTGPAASTGRVFRGGSWYSDAERCRASRRNETSPGSRSGTLGFRVALDLE